MKLIPPKSQENDEQSWNIVSVSWGKENTYVWEIESEQNYEVEEMVG